MFEGSTEFSPINTSLLIVVPSGQTKIWKFDPKHGPAKATDAYTGSPFQVNKAFAQLFSDRWMILSPKYGFMDPDFMIPEDYGVAFKKPETKPISIEELKKQVQEKNLLDFNIVVALGGEEYTDIVTRLFSKNSRVVAPTKGLAMGMGMQRIKSLLNLSREQMLKTITDQNEP
jgi:Family of unknown function (DUF6884)